MSNPGGIVVPDLQQYSREAVASPFNVVLDDGNRLHALEIVRRVPGKRIVCRGFWGEQAIYAKFFIGSQAGKYAARDRRGSKWLAAAGIATPALLLESSVATQGSQVLLYAAIAADNAEYAWQELDKEARHALSKRLVAEVARHHRAGLLQTDLYLKNFLVDAGTVYTLDGDGIRRERYWGKSRQRLDNLARLISKFDVNAVQAWLPGLLQHYAEILEEDESPDLAAMQQRITRHWQYEMRQYAEKVQRTCSDVVAWHSSRTFTAINRPYDSAGLRHALKSPDLLFSLPEAERLKSGNTCTVAAVQIDQRKLVIKRYNIKSFWHGLGRAWRPSRAVQAWANAFRLQLKGIATPAVTAVLERRVWGVRREAYLLAEFVEARDAVAFFADATLDATARQQVATAVARLFYQLCCLQLEHGDFKATNLLVQSLQPVLIDLDSMKQHGCVKCFRRRHVRDLRRFMKNWQSDEATRHLLSKAFRAVYTDQGLLDKAGIK
ncbi:lipopolysaccharide kinase InaA family protein [Methylobacillus arboreus]|uniref:lipopolysaccharide kinase InaA family protein n=1 Tax=Methylobacillus arboreus TaxID=755170 RepID=UPI001E5885AA|nr:lipopolysaccharide kinase InaA family protein [Methylobacillus arboreus]MCB5191583.1 lipopolysaccharide kinase InaA family protein [Methylobacillus arboreus]